MSLHSPDNVWSWITLNLTNSPAPYLVSGRGLVFQHFPGKYTDRTLNGDLGSPLKSWFPGLVMATATRALNLWLIQKFLPNGWLMWSIPWHLEMNAGHKWKFPRGILCNFFFFSDDMLETWLVACFRLFAYHFAVLLHGLSKHILLCSPLSAVSHSSFLFSVITSLRTPSTQQCPLPPIWQLSRRISGAGSGFLPCAMGHIEREICSVMCCLQTKNPRRDHWRARA